MVNLLVAGSPLFEESDFEKLRCAGYEITYIEREDTAEIKNPEKYDVVVCNWLFKYQDIKDFKRLKAVQLLSAGLDRVPVEYIREKNIILSNAKGVYSIPMAEYAVMCVLDFLKKSKELYDNEKLRIWNKIRTAEELSGLTVCILGMGNVGCEVAKRFSSFTDRIIGVDINPVDCPYLTFSYGIRDVKDAVKESNIVIITLPLTEQTKEFVNKDLFESMNKATVLVNIARGGLVNHEDLKEAIRRGIIRYAVLDVFENEPISDEDWRWNDPHIRVTPHCSFISDKNNARLKAIVMKNLNSWLGEIQTDT